MRKFILSLFAFVALSLSFVHTAGAVSSCSTSSLNCSSYMLFDTVYRSDSDRLVNTSLWQPLPNQPVRSFHRLTVKNTSGQSIEIGYGTYAGVVRHVLIAADVGASAQTIVYPFGLSYGGTSQSVYIRAVSGNATSGELTVNFLY